MYFRMFPVRLCEQDYLEKNIYKFKNKFHFICNSNRRIINGHKQMNCDADIPDKCL